MDDEVLQGRDDVKIDDDKDDDYGNCDYVAVQEFGKSDDN